MVIYIITLLLFSLLAVFLSGRDHRFSSLWSVLLNCLLYAYFLLLGSYIFLSLIQVDVPAAALKEAPYSVYDLYVYSLWCLLLAPCSLIAGLAARFLKGIRSVSALLQFSSLQRRALGCVFTAVPLLFAGAFMLNSYGTGSIMISEVCIRNASAYPDENGLYSDYVELYNPLPFNVGTRELYLADDLESIPISLAEYTVVPAKGYTIVWTNRELTGFGLNRNGDSVYLLSGLNQVVDTVQVPALEADTVYARNAATAQWEVHDPSPLAPTPDYAKITIPLEFSAEAGFYEEPFHLTLSAPEGCRIYYTLDCSTPDETSALYTEPILVENVSSRPNVYRAIQQVTDDWLEFTPPTEPVDKAFVLRAIAVDEFGRKSDVITKSYFVDMPQYQEGTVLSLVTDPDGLFGPDGLYITGPEYDAWYLGGQQGEAPFPNFLLDGEEIELETSVELFRDELLMSQSAGLQLQGGGRRYSPLKRFAIHSRPKYSGESYFSYDMFGKNTHSFFTRESFAEVLANDLVSGLGVGGQAAIPAAVFVDGEYWYTEYLRERYDRAYIAETFSVKEDNVEILKEFPEEIYTFVEANPMENAQSYEALNEIMDIQSYVTFLASNIYLCNVDTCEYKNLRIWRAGNYSSLGLEDGRWRFLVYDLDALGWNEYGSKLYTLDTFSIQRPYIDLPPSYNTDPFYSEIKKNPQFCQDFVLTFMDLANTCFEKEHVARVLEGYGLDRTWNHSFFDLRADYIVPFMAQEFDLTGTLEQITLATAQPQMGTLRINSVTPALEDGRWSGRYYTDYPVTITAEPQRGYEFVAWHRGDETYTDNVLQVRLDAGENLWEAEFRKIGE